MTVGHDTSPVEEFCADLRRLWRSSGRDLPQLARDIRISRTQLYAILNGEIKRPPDWDTLVYPLVRACGGTDDELADWRRRHEILVGVHDELRRRRSALPAAAVNPTPAQLPADRDTFTGRAAQLETLDTASNAASSNTSSRARVVIISGLAGVGKSALAVHWAHRVADRFTDGQLYVNLRGFGTYAQGVHPADALRQFLEAFGIPADRIPTSQDAQAALYRSLTVDRRLLIILDNARDAEQIRPLLPAGRHAQTVITSRHPMTGLIAEVGARTLVLDLLPHAEAVDLFLRSLDRQAQNAQDITAAAAIVDACGRLPLAITLAAARANTTRFELETLAAQLRWAAGRLATLDGGVQGGARMVFSWSYESLDPATARMFRLLGLASGADIAVTSAAALAGLPTPEVRPLLRELTDAGLLAEHKPGRYVMHDLTRVYAGELARLRESEDDRRAALTRLLDHYAHTACHADLILNPTRAPVLLALDTPADGVAWEPPLDTKAAQVWLSNERDVLIDALHQAREEGMDTHAWQLSWALDTFLRNECRWQDEGAVWAVALSAAASLTHQPATAHAHAFSAIAASQLQRFDEAHSHMRQALELTKTAGDLQGEAETQFSLSYVCWLQGDHQAALEHAQDALTSFASLGHTAWESKSSRAVAWYHAQLGAYQEAMPLYLRALALDQQADDHANEAVTSDSLGLLYQQIGDYDQAAQHHRHGLRLAQVTANPLLEAQILTHLGEAHEALAEAETARSLWRRALEILAPLGHPQAADVRHKLETKPAATADALSNPPTHS